MAPTPKAWLDPTKPVVERVQLWMTESGFPLEHSAAATLSNASFMVSQGLHVPSDDGDDGLEVDLIGSYVYGGAEFHLMIECKVVPAPGAWVVLMHRDEMLGAPIDGIGSTAIAQHSAETITPDTRALEPPWSSTRGMAIRTMKSGRPADIDKESPADHSAYAAVQGLIGRTVGWLRMRDRELPEQPELVIPTLVVGGDLLTAKWDTATASFKIEETDRTWIGWSGHRNWTLPYFTCAVVTLKGLEAHAREMMTWAQSWCTDATEGAQLGVLAMKQRAQVGKWTDHLPPNKAYRKVVG